MHRFKPLAMIAAAAAVAALALTTPAKSDLSAAGQKALAAAGKVMFEQRCRVCHAQDFQHPSYGPALKGIVGRKAGSVVGFQYSDAMRQSGIMWDEDTLRKWIADNTGLVPGTRMRHVKITDLAEQDFLLAYLRSISAD